MNGTVKLQPSPALFSLQPSLEVLGFGSPPHGPVEVAKVLAGVPRSEGPLRQSDCFRPEHLPSQLLFSHTLRPDPNPGAVTSWPAVATEDEDVDGNWLRGEFRDSELGPGRPDVRGQGAS